MMVLNQAGTAIVGVDDASFVRITPVGGRARVEKLAYGSHIYLGEYREYSKAIDVLKAMTEAWASGGKLFEMPPDGRKECDLW